MPRSTPRPLTRNQALDMAIKAIRTQKQRIAFDANCHKLYGADYQHAINCAAKYDKYAEAIAILESLKTERETKPISDLPLWSEQR